MPRPKLYTDEELAIRNKEARRKYAGSLKGKEKQKIAVKKYQQTEKFKDYKKNYYQQKKNTPTTCSVQN